MPPLRGPSAQRGLTLAARDAPGVVFETKSGPAAARAVRAELIRQGADVRQHSLFPVPS